MLRASDLTDGQRFHVAASVYGVDDMGRFHYIHLLSGDDGWCPYHPGVDDHDLAVFLAKGGGLPSEDFEPPDLAPCTGPCRDCPGVVG